MDTYIYWANDVTFFVRSSCSMNSRTLLLPSPLVLKFKMFTLGDTRDTANITDTFYVWYWWWMNYHNKQSELADTPFSYNCLFTVCKMLNKQKRTSDRTNNGYVLSHVFWNYNLRIGLLNASDPYNANNLFINPV
jgi:hypothetical protein